MSISIQTLEKICDSIGSGVNHTSENSFKTDGPERWQRWHLMGPGSLQSGLLLGQSLTAATVDCFCLTVPSGLAQLMLGKWILP